MATHQLHHGDPVFNTPRLCMGAVDDPHSFVNRSTETKGACDKMNIVIDRLGDSHHGQWMPAPAGLFKQFVPSPLCAIPTHREENIHMIVDEIFHGCLHVYRPPRCAEHGPSLLMDVLDKIIREFDRRFSPTRIKPAITAANTKNGFHAIAANQFAGHRADDIIKSGTKPSTGDDGCTGMLGIKEQLFPGACLFKQHEILRDPSTRPLNLGGCEHLVADRKENGGFIPGISQLRDGHCFHQR